jgi:beta-N-acetylhexosaminidase
LPFKNTLHEKIAYVKLGDGLSDTFFNTLKSEINIDNLSGLSHKELLESLKKYDKVIIGYHRLNYRLTKDISDEDRAMIEIISKKNKVILDVFASQYCLEKVLFKKIESVIVSFENSEEAQKISAQIILGKKDAKGELPASINSKYSVGYGI